MNRTLHVINTGLVVLLVAGSLWVYPTLPEQIPRHFGLGGTADAFWDASLAHWMVLPFCAIGTGALVYGAAWVIDWAPSSLSIPNREEYDALDPSAQRVVVGVVQRFLYGTAFGLFVLFSVFQVGTYQAAVAASNSLPTYVLGVFVVFLIGEGGGTV